MQIHFNKWGGTEEHKYVFHDKLDEIGKHIDIAQDAVCSSSTKRQASIDGTLFVLIDLPLLESYTHT